MKSFSLFNKLSFQNSKYLDFGIETEKIILVKSGDLQFLEKAGFSDDQLYIWYHVSPASPSLE